MKKSKNQVWFVYDGKCPICNGAANAFMIKDVLGTLNLVDARTQKNHPVMIEINNLGLNLDEGMVIKFKDNIYHGSDALHVMALIGTNSGFFNKVNCFLFRSKILSKICYPFLRLGRNFVLYIKGVEKLN
jgi:predicted DCC family thiol-disulfide oxidoreductase YuxK